MATVTFLVVCALTAALLWSPPRTGRYRLAALLPRPRRRWSAPRFRSPLAARREDAERRRAVITLCRVMSAELRAGQPPELALRVAAAEAGPHVGEPTDAESLRATARRQEGLWALAYLAVCWEVASETGAGMATVVDDLAANLTEQEELRAEAAARTAGPRTTALMLSGLPLVGLAMSAGLGGSPWQFLLTTPLGLLCLGGGLLLDVAGAWWTLRLVRGAVEHE
ncbi:type II secretion system F family protein [Nocardiopsis sp. MG754419]|uniref:type II secretion system F family protein n=1 Tax=Nocardiopsis sp. MG754419 TaxID=2259865 RepID=UPI001BA49697|nr:type II secretion system F family protein [Nocardiopsis sp. MG754419]MBR8742000.1 type II secretion protein F [Nocardiopsis sp. MG754419]